MNRSLAAVTGASSGIGAEYARQLASKGYDLLLVARRAERLEKLAASLRDSFGIAVEVMVADLSDTGQCREVAQRLEASQSLEMLVNNAGFLAVGELIQEDLEVQERMHRLHVLATLILSHSALKGMVARNRGNLINVSSLAAFWQGPGIAGYCATKCWMNSFTEGLYLDLRNRRSSVRVQVLCPGYTESEIMDNEPSVPAALVMSAESVVRQSLEGLEQGKFIVIPGRRNQLARFSGVTWVKLLPRTFRPRAIGKLLRFRWF